MTLLLELSRAKTEEDVKDAYIKALGLKSYFKGLVDIQTEEVWFEAKEAATPPILMFAQLLVYVRAARKRGESVPAFLAVIDREKAAIMPTEHALPILENKDIVWPKSGSAADKALAAQIAPTIETHFVVYEIASNEKEFVKAVTDAIKQGRIIRTPITPDNLRQVFDKWVNMVGCELGVTNPADYAVLFFADIMHDGANAAMSNLPARLRHHGEIAGQGDAVALVQFAVLTGIFGVLDNACWQKTSNAGCERDEKSMRATPVNCSLHK